LWEDLRDMVTQEQEDKPDSLQNSKHSKLSAGYGEIRSSSATCSGSNSRLEAAHGELLWT